MRRCSWQRSSQQSVQRGAFQYAVDERSVTHLLAEAVASTHSSAHGPCVRPSAARGGSPRRGILAGEFLSTGTALGRPAREETLRLRREALELEKKRPRPLATPTLPDARRRRPKERNRSSENTGSTRKRPARDLAVVICGFGRLGGAMALGLKAAGFGQSRCFRARMSRFAAPSTERYPGDHEALQWAPKLCLFAVPDSVFRRVSRRCSAIWGRDRARPLRRTLDLAVFGQDAATLTQSFPADSFPSVLARSRTRATCSGRSLGRTDAGWVALMTTPELEAAGLGLTASFTWAISLALPTTPGRCSARVGSPRCSPPRWTRSTRRASTTSRRWRPLLPQMHSALRGITQPGARAASPAPWPGEMLATVEAHLRALPAELAKLYRLLSLPRAHADASFQIEARERVGEGAPADVTLRKTLLSSRSG